MAIAFDAATDGGNSGSLSTSHTFSHTCTGSNLILFIGFLGDTNGGNDDITSVTYGGVAASLVGKVTAFGQRNAYLYQLTGPGTGANNVVISCTNGHYLIAGAVSYTGAAQSGQPDASTTNHGSSSSLTTTLTTNADNCWTVLFGEVDFGATPTAGSGTLRRTKDGMFNIWGLFDSNAAITPGGSTSLIHTGGGGGNASVGIMASIAPVASGFARPYPFIEHIGGTAL